MLEIDINAEANLEPVLASQKKTRNIWKEAHQFVLVNRIYLDECCPVGKRTHKEVDAAWTSLV